MMGSPLAGASFPSLPRTLCELLDALPELPTKQALLDEYDRLTGAVVGGINHCPRCSSVDHDVHGGDHDSPVYIICGNCYHRGPQGLNRKAAIEAWNKEAS